MQQSFINISGFKELNENVISSIDGLSCVTNEDIDHIILKASQAQNKRARILLHTSKEDNLHEMIICIPHDSFDKPHINFKSGKSFLALRGIFAVIIFSNCGTEFNIYILSHDGSIGGRMLRLNDPLWHTIVPIEGNCVFLETIAGPFTGNQFASFYHDQCADAIRFRTKIKDAIAAFMNQQR